MRTNKWFQNIFSPRAKIRKSKHTRIPASLIFVITHLTNKRGKGTHRRSLPTRRDYVWPVVRRASTLGAIVYGSTKSIPRTINCLCPWLSKMLEIAWCPLKPRSLESDENFRNQSPAARDLSCVFVVYSQSVIVVIYKLFSNFETVFLLLIFFSFFLIRLVKIHFYVKYWKIF